MSALTSLIVLVWWMAGIVLAKGFWLTVVAMFTPYGMYIVLEKIFLTIGWMPI